MIKLYVSVVLVIGLSFAALIFSFVDKTQAHSQDLNGVLFDAASGRPLKGEIGVSFKRDGRLHFRHAFADEAGRFFIAGLPSTEV